MNSKDDSPIAVNTAVRPARMDDGSGIAKLVNYWAAQGQMLPRTLGETYEHLRDFYVVEDEDDIVGCAALHLVWSDLAEVKSVAVDERMQGLRIGATLVNACVDEAIQLGLSRIFALTYQPEFFEKLGWKRADVMSLPRKVWNECYRCPKFPSCDEIAMILELE
ncbi:MAG: GNAT family N-acetyltransferase [Chloroflexi bacterium]|nr:GNAT family N-acetyltransferase [Chloroflexota bacterium]|tara:strand:+ start:637 stop:1128 length:492 start_codon:yes stop_codon:yes gene_type:complete